MKKYSFAILLLSLVLVNLLAHWFFFRIDLTDDKRYSLGEATKTLLRTSDKVEVDLFLDGNLNSGFLRLKEATVQLLRECDAYGDVKCTICNPAQMTQEEQQALVDELATYGYIPTAVYERDRAGKTTETIVYPYARLRYGDKSSVLCLLQNNRGLSGAENLNNSIESLEYLFAESLYSLSQGERAKIVFLEGHGELDEHLTADVQRLASASFDVYRGTMTTDADCLNPFKVVVIADPQKPFSEQDKYILDQYVMHGGRILWALSGVRLSEEVLSQNGFTPILPMDLNLQDLLFRYGVRINPRLVADMQCLSIPVDVSRDPNQPQYEPIPWCYAPMLLTSADSPITHNLMQLSSAFVSDLDFVGDSLAQKRTILLATGNASRLIATPAEIDLSDLSITPELFTTAYVPVAACVEGAFSSLFAHRMVPQGITASDDKSSESVPTKQVFIASGSVLQNDWQNNQPLPCGYDRYSKMQFGNRDFFVNALSWLADDMGLINLRQKSIPLRLLNTTLVNQNKNIYTVYALLLPLLLLGLTAALVFSVRRVRYKQ